MKNFFATLVAATLIGCAPSATTPPASPSTPLATTNPVDVASTRSETPNAPTATTTPREVAATPGGAAPTPAAKDQTGQPVQFAELYKKGPVLVYFYPKADTPGCTAQACSLRDSYQKLSDVGLTVVGVSTDDQAAQLAFQEKYQLPFVLVADPEGLVLKAFGVSSLGGMANREAFLIKDGQIVWHDASASTAQQADDVLAQMTAWKTP